jgi:hypothetical protein
MNKSDKQAILRLFLNMLEEITEDHYLGWKRKIPVPTLIFNQIKKLNPKHDYKSDLLGLASESDLLDCGLLTQGEQGSYFVFYGCCCIIPFFVDGEIAFLQGRTEEKGGYRNIAQEKNTPFYIPKLNGLSKLFICEGAITTLSIMDYEVGDVIGLLDSGIASQENVKTEIIRILNRFRDKEIIFVPDMDLQGLNACFSVMNLMQQAGISYQKTFLNVQDLALNANFSIEEARKIKDYNDYIMMAKAGAN